MLRSGFGNGVRLFDAGGTLNSTLGFASLRFVGRCKMHAVHEGRVVATHEQRCVLRDRMKHRLDPLAVGLGEIMEHVAVHQLLRARMPDPDAHAAKLFSDVRLDRLQALVPGGAAAGLHAELSGRQVELVVDHHDVARRELVEAHRLRDGAAGLVHVGRRLQQERLLAAEVAFRCLALKPRAPGREAVTAMDFVHRHEADVVSVATVAPAGIAKTHDEQHPAIP